MNMNCMTAYHITGTPMDPFANPLPKQLPILSQKNTLINDNIENKHFDEFTGNKTTSNFPEVEIITDSILNSEKISEIDKNIYKEYAPYEFMYTYRYKIFEAVKNETIDFDELERLFLYCEARLPLEDYFLEFKDQFSGLSLLISILIEVPDYFNENWSEIKEIIIEMWFTFTSGIRVKQKDRFYNKNESSWDLEFKNALSKLNDKIDKFDTKLLNAKLDFPEMELSDSEKKILSTLFKDYMGD